MRSLSFVTALSLAASPAIAQEAPIFLTCSYQMTGTGVEIANRDEFKLFNNHLYYWDQTEQQYNFSVISGCTVTDSIIECSAYEAYAESDLYNKNQNYEIGKYKIWRTTGKFEGFYERNFWHHLKPVSKTWVEFLSWSKKGSCTKGIDHTGEVKTIFRQVDKAAH